MKWNEDEGDTTVEDGGTDLLNPPMNAPMLCSTQLNSTFTVNIQSDTPNETSINDDTSMDEPVSIQSSEQDPLTPWISRHLSDEVVNDGEKKFQWKIVCYSIPRNIPYLLCLLVRQ